MRTILSTLIFASSLLLFTIPAAAQSYLHLKKLDDKYQAIQKWGQILKQNGCTFQEVRKALKIINYNLFLEEHFVPFMGKPIHELTVDERLRIRKDIFKIKDSKKYKDKEIWGITLLERCILESDRSMSNVFAKVGKVKECRNHYKQFTYLISRGEPVTGKRKKALETYVSRQWFGYLFQNEVDEFEESYKVYKENLETVAQNKEYEKAEKWFLVKYESAESDESHTLNEYTFRKLRELLGPTSPEFRKTYREKIAQLEIKSWKGKLRYLCESVDALQTDDFTEIDKWDTYIGHKYYYDKYIYDFDREEMVFEIPNYITTEECSLDILADKFLLKYEEYLDKNFNKLKSQLDTVTTYGSLTIIYGDIVSASLWNFSSLKNYKSDKLEKLLTLYQSKNDILWPEEQKRIAEQHKNHLPEGKKSCSSCSGNGYNIIPQRAFILYGPIVSNRVTCPICNGRGYFD